MKFFYQPTALESWISRLYQTLSIHTPEYLDEDTVAEALNTFLFHEEISPLAYEEGQFKSITIDCRGALAEQHDA